MIKIKMPVADTAASAREYALASMALVSLQVAALGVVPVTPTAPVSPRFTFKVQPQPAKARFEAELAGLFADMESGVPFQREDGAADALKRLAKASEIDMDRWADEVAESVSDAAG